MTKKDFEVIAGVLRVARGAADTDELLLFVQSIAAHFAQVLADRNPEFDTGRFLKATGAGS